MPPHKCAYFRCDNTSDMKSMFRFPCQDADIRKQWLDNCGNMAITHLPPENLRFKYLCIDHFDHKYILNINGKRKRLKKNAVPEPFLAPEALYHSCTSSSGSPTLKVLRPKKTYSRKRRSSISYDDDDLEEDCCHYPISPKRRKRDIDNLNIHELRSLLIKKNKQLQRQTIKNKKNKRNKNFVDLSKHNFSSETSKLITKMQLRTVKKPWTQKEKKFCMSLYYKSPSAYKFMINSGIILAAPSTIQRWLQQTNCLPGIDNEIFDYIKIKFSDKSIKERACAICFDEMSIMVDLEYSMKYDLIEGFEDFGGGKRNSKEAKYALVFIARGIYINWKIPVAYFLSSKNVDSDKLKSILISIINKLFNSGLLPKVTICDQATTNVRLIKTLGATVDCPFYFIDNHKIFAIFDTPHLIKNIRNNLINNDYDLDNNQISFKDIINVYEIDKKNKSKSLKKLTPVHINPNNFQKMKVKYATQIFSNAVAAAIRTAIASGELKSRSANYTADFVQLCNDLFDSLNSKNKFDQNPYRCAITKNRNSTVNQILIKSKEVFNKLKKVSFNKSNEIRLSRPPCFDGMIQTINAVLQLSAEEFSEGTGVKFLITYRLNQDVIENLFGIYRIKGGCNKNPTSKSLRALFRSSLLNSLMKFDNTNCESDQDYFLPINQNQDPIPSNPKPSTSSSMQQDESLSFLDVCSGSDGIIISEIPNSEMIAEELVESSEISLEKCAVVYFAGWLGKSCIDKFNCLNCKRILLKDQVDLSDKKQLLLINRTYSNIPIPTLKSPSDYLFKLVNDVLDFYNDNTNELYRNKLVENLMNEVKKRIDYSDFHDLNHFDYLIKKLLEVKIHDYCKGKKKSIQSAAASASKLRILQNK